MQRLPRKLLAVEGVTVKRGVRVAGVQRVDDRWALEGVGRPRYLQILQIQGKFYFFPSEPGKLLYTYYY